MFWWHKNQDTSTHDIDDMIWVKKSMSINTDFDMDFLVVCTQR